MLTTATPTLLDIGEVLDTGPWSALQKRVAALATLAVLLDGFDSQLVSFVIPVLIKQWHVARGDFALVVAAGLVGMAIGSFFAGKIGDRFGRRLAIIISLVVLGAANVAIGFADNLAVIGALRLVAGFGIGGALPNATTMTAEYTPGRHRTMAVTATITCVPLGGMMAGLFAAAVLPGLGWRWLFWIGGTLPLLFGVLLVLLLAESPRFLSRRGSRRDDLVALLRKMGRTPPQNVVFTDAAETKMETAEGLKALFGGAFLRDTVALWGACFLCLLSVYSAFSWLPTMLSAQGLDASRAASGLTAYNCGGVIGALACAVAIARYGSRWPQILCALGAAASAMTLEFLGLGDERTMVLWLGLQGLFVNAVQSTLYAVAAYTYPTRVRATGTATALAVGRLGAVLSAFVGASVISRAGPDSFLDVLAWAMLGAAGCLFVLRRHIPPTAPAETAAKPIARSPETT